jgi:ABC-type transport system involved in multi-copper enzyme maturation permease subunit
MKARGIGESARILLRGGIVKREIRASLSAAAAIALFQALYPLIMATQSAFGGHGFRVDSDVLAHAWNVSSVVMALLLGVLCGGEEEENQTADFAARLPIPRLRILAEKIAGAALAFCLWGVLALAVDLFLVLCVGRNPIDVAPRIVAAIGNNLVALPLSWGILLFFCGLAAGAWTRKVLISAVIGGLGGWVYGVAGIFLFHGGDFSQAMTQLHWPLAIFWIGGFAALILAVYRYLIREGT